LGIHKWSNRLCIIYSPFLIPGTHLLSRLHTQFSHRRVTLGLFSEAVTCI
jgi:hypothetical protein